MYMYLYFAHNVNYFFPLGNNLIIFKALTPKQILNLSKSPVYMYPTPNY